MMQCNAFLTHLSHSKTQEEILQEQKHEETCKKACDLFAATVDSWLHDLYSYLNLKMDVRGWKILRV